MIKGYSKLTVAQQQAFNRVYEAHQAALGTEERQKWIPKSVKWMGKGMYFRVDFKNGEWLHYTISGTWY